MQEKQEQQYNPFGFLQNQDSEFDAAMKRMNNMSDSVWKTDNQVDTMLQSLKEQNNKVLQPIDKMSNQIFKRDQPINKNDPVYKKISHQNYSNNHYMNPQRDYPQNNHYQLQDDIQEDDIVIGEPVGIESQKQMLNQKKYIKNESQGNYFGNIYNQGSNYHYNQNSHNGYGSSNYNNYDPNNNWQKKL